MKVGCQDSDAWVWDSPSPPQLLVALRQRAHSLGTGEIFSSTLGCCENEILASEVMCQCCVTGSWDTEIVIPDKLSKYTTHKHTYFTGIEESVVIRDCWGKYLTETGKPSFRFVSSLVLACARVNMFGGRA